MNKINDLEPDMQTVLDTVCAQRNAALNENARLLGIISRLLQQIPKEPPAEEKAP